MEIAWSINSLLFDTKFESDYHVCSNALKQPTAADTHMYTPKKFHWAAGELKTIKTWKYTCPFFSTIFGKWESLSLKFWCYIGFRSA